MTARADAWGEFGVYMAEPGFVAIRCKCGIWDQFPLFEGKVDLKWLTDWAAAHACAHPTEAGGRGCGS